MKRTLLAIGSLVFAATVHGAGPATTFDGVRASYAPSDARLLDRDGGILHELRVDPSVRRLQWTRLDAVSPALTAAVVVSEDRRFFQHGGVDFAAVAAAGWSLASGGHRRGASTISMQLAALLDPELRRGSGPRSLGQKWRQMRAAWELESVWSKEEILEAYLNLAAFRGELQGVAAASAVLFDKQPHGLSEAEAVVLAALLRAPNADRATLTRRSHRASTRDLLLPQIDVAVSRAVDQPRGTGPRVKLAPHVARRLLRPGATGDVGSALDASLQRFATASLRQRLLGLRQRQVHDGAVLIVDNASGDVLAYVGSSGDLSAAPEVDGVRARRQAGSSLKPFLYAEALDQRLLTAATLLEDAPLELQVGGGLYRPQNYDEHFRGLVSARTALAASLNVPAVRVLQLLGPEVLAQTLRHLGLSLDRAGDDYGPSLALGSADVSLWELVGAYRALARGGVWQPLHLEPGAGEGSRPPCGANQASAEGCRVFSPAAAFLVGDILADRESRTATFGLDSPLVTRFWSAVKTGTSKDMRDNWCIGFSPRYTVGVWVGNFSGRPMHDVSGVSGAAPVWLEIMEWLHRAGASAAPAAPPSVVARHVSFESGGEPARDEWFVAGTERPWDRLHRGLPTRNASEGPARGARAVHLTALPHIVSPAPEAIIALDPDIPVARQRVSLEARGSGSLVLDGVPLGGTSHLWQPQPGPHSLALVDERGRVLDGIAFLVRGPAKN